ncbi:MAG: DNA-packaging protein [Patescibacteria group bacterium]|nr:DNA-packaging protein [Patescibacteria group bacterium]
MFLSMSNWVRTAREKQLTPKGMWRIWLLLAGRGFGKTRTAAEDIKRYAWENDGARIGICAPTFADMRDICFEGESGLLGIIPPSAIDGKFNRSIGELKLKNGSMLHGFSADDPDRLRGHQFHRFWADELASYKGKITQKDAATEGVPGTPKPMLTQIELCTRLKPSPRIVITTTPRPLKILKEVIARRGTVVSSGSTYENRDNLAQEFISSIVDLYEGSRLGRQELYAEILDEVEGALWNRLMLDETRLDPKKDSLPSFKRVVVAVDPAVTANPRSNETGIVVIGLTFGGRAIVLQDASGKYTPEGWATEAVRCYENWKADRVVAEKNQGGDLVAATLRAISSNLPVKLVDATKGKITRAEPVAGLYEQKKVSHWGIFPALEDQMCEYTGAEREESPDRLDALVWGLTELMLTGRPVLHVAVPGGNSAPSAWPTAGDVGSFSVTTDDFIVMG